MTHAPRDERGLLERQAEAKRRRGLGVGPRVRGREWTPQAAERFIADAKHVFPGSYEPGSDRRWRR